jgi:N-acetyl-anhydromuramyl-L-alanine amidase AmpD
MIWLDGIEQVPCTQHSSRGGVEPDVVVIHYSVSGGTARQVLEYFAKRRKVEASYHAVVGGVGDTAQGVPQDRASWHGAGVYPGDAIAIPGKVNRRSVGICLVNWGWMMAHADDVVTATHAKGGNLLRWQLYPDVQIAAFRGVLARVLEVHPTITRVCGHEDVNRYKVDPGPAFPWLEALGGTGLIRYWNDWPKGLPRWQQMKMR